MTVPAVTDADTEARIERTRMLKAVGFDPKNPVHRAAVEVANKYGLDPLLKHVIVLDGRGIYVTRDGLLSVAHRSGELDGIVLEDEGEDDTGWWAIVSVYRKDMGHPFRYRGRYPRKGSNARYGPEMAVKCAEVMALRRAFQVTGIATLEEQWDAHDQALHDIDPDDAA